MKQYTAEYEVKDLSELADLISYLNEEGFVINETVVLDRHDEERGNYLNVLLITIPILKEQEADYEYSSN